MTDHSPQASSQVQQRMTGGCQCGAVRYLFKGVPGSASFCHCRMCQKAGGNVGLALVRLDVDHLKWTQGTPSEFRSSSVVSRGFCQLCGTPLYMREDGDACIEVTIGSLDRPAPVDPTEQVGIESRIDWFDTLHTLPQRRTDEDRTPGDLAKLASRQHPDQAD